ncbi:MAG TPA: transposase [Phycisphaerae bacterium]|nr:transposase [Phycisphaerae bacterium]
MVQDDKGYHRKRCKRWDEYGSAHFLTFSCFRRQAFLRRHRTCHWVVDAIDAARAKRPFELWGFVIMPDHVHILLLPHQGVRISRILEAIKTPVARRAVAWVRKNAPGFLERMAHHHADGSITHRFWQSGGGYDRSMRSVRDMHEKLEYLHYNPVRRGLVTQPEQWRWSSYRAWAEATDEPIPINRDSFPPLLIT